MAGGGVCALMVLEDRSKEVTFLPVGKQRDKLHRDGHLLHHSLQRVCLAHHLSDTVFLFDSQDHPMSWGRPGRGISPAGPIGEGQLPKVKQLRTTETVPSVGSHCLISNGPLRCRVKCPIATRAETLKFPTSVHNPAPCIRLSCSGRVILLP